MFQARWCVCDGCGENGSDELVYVSSHELLVSNRSRKLHEWLWCVMVCSISRYVYAKTADVVYVQYFQIWVCACRVWRKWLHQGHSEVRERGSRIKNVIFA